jgi:DNA-directed RNA polymerase subunit H (RpoH/RPB5)
MNFADIEDIYRSRKTLLEILDGRGYETEPFQKFSPLEIAIAVPNPESIMSLSFTTKQRDNKDKICMVLYAKLSRQKLMTMFEDYPNEDTAEIIVMIMEPVADVHHALALRLYLSKQIRISFFSVFHLVNNPLNHFLVPKHEIVPKEEEEAIMKKYNTLLKSKFPLIRFHVDPIVRLLGAVPNDIIKITRPSPVSGNTVYYRVVSA